MKSFLSYLSDKLSILYSPQESRVISRSLMRELVSMTDNEIYGGKDIKIPDDKRCLLHGAVDRLAEGEPLQYVIGSVDFYGLSLHVRRPVLIPRPETEELVDWIVKDRSEDKGLSVLDVGTGSGCIALSLASHLKSSFVTAWDVLPEALDLACENARLNGLSVVLEKQDLFEVISSDEIGKNLSLDLLVSNPPYVRESESADMSARVLDYESPLALFVSDEDPLRYYAALALLGKKCLKPGGGLYVEVNSALGPQTCSLFEREGYSRVCLRKDIFGRDRMVRALFP